MQSARDRLQGVRVAKTTTLKTMLESLRDQVVSISDSKAVIEVMRAFRATLGQEENAKPFAFERDGALQGHSAALLPWSGCSAVSALPPTSPRPWLRP
jgi:hypothetical protein